MESSTRSSILIALVVLGLAVNSAQGQGNLLGNIGATANNLVGGITGSLGLGQLGQATNNIINAPLGLVNSLTRPLGGVFNSANQYSTGVKFNEFSERPIGDSLVIGNGVVDGFTTGLAAASGLAGVSNSNRRLHTAANLGAAKYGNGLGAGLAGGLTGSTAGALGAQALTNAEGNLQNVATLGAMGAGALGAYGGYGSGSGAAAAAVAGAAASEGMRGGLGLAGSAGLAAGAEGAAAAGLALDGASAMHQGIQARAMETGAAMGAAAGGALAASAMGSSAAAAHQIAGRQVLANEALANAQAESAIAGADMVAHGANNARSASLASNAYRQAKLASSRDRVNIAGTIQNSARISDAAIATHDAATKAEDSLMGSELAVDSAATVLDSDAAYIPPVTNSLLRSLPYGRIGLRNIVPKPLTYPSVLLPDVWLNGQPVNYLNVPFRMLPYTIGPNSVTNQLQFSGHSLANGFVLNGQPYYANNGILINGMVVDPSVAHLALGNGVYGSSVFPILANGQVEAQDEVAAANMISLQQQMGAGSSATYHGYGRFNTVPMLTGSVTDVNLAPTTTIGTTYPIGSALVIEPRDSFFQDYIDNASSRQNFDEHQQ